MFPRMRDEAIQAAIDRDSESALGWTLSGAGGGYLILVSEAPVESTLRIKIRRLVLSQAGSVFDIT